MNQTKEFIELVKSTKPEIPLRNNYNHKEYYELLYNYYGLTFNQSSFGDKEIKDAIIKKIKMFLLQRKEPYIFHNDLKNIQKQIIIEHIAYGKDFEPYYSILFFIRDLCRDVRLLKSIDMKEDWSEIIKTVKEYFVLNRHEYKNDEELKLFENRSLAIGSTMKYFKEKYGLIINSEDGVILLNESILDEIYREIERMIKTIGGLNVISCILFISKNKYNMEQHRFHFTRNFSDMQNIEPDLPIGYLINIALKHIRINIELSQTDIVNHMNELFELAKRYCSLYDVQSYNQWEDIIIAHENLPYKLHEFVLYDTIFNINQFNPYHIREFLKEIFSDIDERKIGINISQYIDFISNILENQKDTFTPCIINKREFYRRNISLLTTTIDKLFNIFSFNYYEVNKQYKFPSQYSECNAPFRPLINIAQDKFVLLNPSICSFGAYEALLDHIRSKISDIDDKIGLQMEHYVKKLLSNHNIIYSCGKYKDKSAECDIISVCL
jgi:hypothetical protein